MFEVGNLVIVLEPFNQAFPGEYLIESIKEDGTCVINEDRDFDPVYLKKVS